MSRTKIKNALKLRKILNYMSVDLKQINNKLQNNDQKDPSQSRCSPHYTALCQSRKRKKYQLSYCCWIIFLSISFMTEKFLRKQQILLIEYYKNNICDCPWEDLWLLFPEYHQKLRIYQQSFYTEMTSYILSFPYFWWVSTGSANSSAW